VKQRLLATKHQGFGRTAASCSQTENRVPKKQKLFQEDSGIPVHPEHGIMDALVYTLVLQIGKTCQLYY
uniref:Cytochrome c oxidase subunit 7A2, mitochondrial n=1 Tax=Anser brachyrhynchus TaxID=132585 RepID=A0A8B9C1Y9_9AVES